MSDDAGDSLASLAAMPCRPGAPRLAPADLEARLRRLPGWAFAEDALVKSFRFADYPATIEFVNAVAGIAIREDHHPDLSVHYDRCVVRWTTHDAGGVTDNDVACAAKIEGFRP